MASSTRREAELESPKINLRHKLAGLWITAMFFYIYADILAFYDDYLLGEILKGIMPTIGPITQQLKFGIGVFMSIPAIMVYVSLAVKHNICRWANLASGTLFTAVSIATTVMSRDYYYMYFGVLEAGATTYVVWLAWRWRSFR